jgi:hypothetical protein
MQSGQPRACIQSRAIQHATIPVLYSGITAGDAAATAALYRRVALANEIWLARAFPSTPTDLLHDAVTDAFLDFLRDAVVAWERGIDPERFIRTAAWRNARDSARRNRRRCVTEEQYARSSAQKTNDLCAHLLEQNGRQLLERLLAVCSYRDRAALRVWLSGEESFSRIAPYIGAGSLPISDQRREVKRFKDRIRRTAKRLGLRASVRLLFHG